MEITWLFLFIVFSCIVAGNGYGNKQKKKEPDYSHNMENRIELEMIDLSDNICAVTSDDRQYPWWQVELDEIAAIRKIEIDTGNKTNLYRLHDLDVRVGIVDLANDISGDKIFHHNSLCKHFPGVLDATKLEFTCNHDIAGKFVTLQITKRCVFPACLRHKGNFLKLCKVKVMGNYISLWDLNEDEIRDVERERQEFNLSSIAFNGHPNLAKTPKEEKLITPNPICASPSESREGTFTGRHYIVEFGYYFLVQKVAFKNVVKDPLTYRVHLKVYTYKEIVKDERDGKVRMLHSICGEWSGDITKGETYEFLCERLTLGFAGIVEIASDKVDANFLTGCSIFFWGHKVVNLAKYKPTKQSSTRKGTPQSFAAVDGIKPRRTHFRSEHTTRPHCTRSEANDKYPWWRVDLIRLHMVRAVYVSTGSDDGSTLKKMKLHLFAHSPPASAAILKTSLRPLSSELWGENWLHDLQIRVGGEDIANAVNKSLFQENHVCQDFTGHVLNEFTLYVDCQPRLLGRFVSIQVTRPCDNILCKKKKMMSLSLCEVEVFGLPIDLYYYGNMAVGRKLLRSQHLLPYYKLHGEEEGLGNFGWLYIYLKHTSIVKTVVLYPYHEDIAEMRINAQIRVGYDEMIAHAHREWLLRNDLCFEGHFNITTEKYLEISCDKPVFGSKLLIQYECEWNVSDTSCNKLLLFSSIEVWVYRIRSPKHLQERPHHSDETLNYGWKNDNVDVLAKEVTSIVESVEPPFKCTHTKPGEDPFPWFKITFPDVYMITHVEFNNTDDDTSQRLHNIDIRIGYEDISKAPTEKPFTGNSLCYSSDDMPLDKGFHNISCTEPLLGTFLSIQIVKPCTLAEECDTLEPNILHLCHVRLYGKRGESKDIMEDLAYSKPSVQSSIFSGKYAMLANTVTESDGKN